MNTTRAIFLFEPEGDPFYNMACDGALFRSFSEKKYDISAVLRLYSWAIPAITIGYNQDISRALDMSRVESGLPVIRRITGGRAIYHDRSELTFSLLARMNLLPYGKSSLTEINTAVSLTLVDFLNEVGISSVWRRHSDANFKSNGPPRSGACFASVSRYEIVSQGVKIVGGAQRRSGDCFIHQGSIKANGIATHPALGPVGGDFPGDDTNCRSIRISDIKEIFVGNFSKGLGIKFDEDRLSPEVIGEIDIETGKLRQNPLLKK